MNSLNEILAAQVQAGKMTIDQAYQIMNANKMPQIAGFAPDGSGGVTPLGLMPKEGGGWKIGPLEGSGTGFMPKSQMGSVPASVADDVGQGFNSLKLLDGMETKLKEIGPNFTGRVVGRATQAAGWMGWGDAAADFSNMKDQFKLSAQAMIKGIPSNFDVQTVIATLPDLDMPYRTAQEKIKLARDLTTNLLKNSISYWKSKSPVIPSHIQEMAELYNINVNDIAAWSGSGDPLIGESTGRAFSAPTRKRIRFDAQGNEITE